MASNCPVPVFDNKSLVEHKLVIPVIAEWLATTKQTLSDWQRLPKAVVQLLNFTIDSFSDDTWVQVRVFQKIKRFKNQSAELVLYGDGVN